MTTQPNTAHTPTPIPYPDGVPSKPGTSRRFVLHALFGVVSAVMALIGLMLPWQQSWWDKGGHRQTDQLGAFHEQGLTKVPAIVITIVVVVGLLAVLVAMFFGRSAKGRVIVCAVYTVANVVVSLTLLFVMTSQSAVAKVRQIGIPMGSSGGVGFGVGLYLTLVASVLGIIVGIVLITQAVRNRPTIG